MIQRASERALKQGTSLEDVLRLAIEVRKESDAGLIVFTYLNPMLRFGMERFCSEAAKAVTQQRDARFIAARSARLSGATSPGSSNHMAAGRGPNVRVAVQQLDQNNWGISATMTKTDPAKRDWQARPRDGD